MAKDEEPKTPAERQRDYEKRLRERGFRRYCVWLPGDDEVGALFRKRTQRLKADLKRQGYDVE